MACEIIAKPDLLNSLMYKYLMFIYLHTSYFNVGFTQLFVVNVRHILGWDKFIYLYSSLRKIIKKICYSFISFTDINSILMKNSFKKKVILSCDNQPPGFHYNIKCLSAQIEANRLCTQIQIQPYVPPSLQFHIIVTLFLPRSCNFFYPCPSYSNKHFWS